ncbi:MAG: DUF3641 domain-containing protein [Actinobacteria bacterium]|nr:DUF3641 domain-containing protein [Actinomycetota bacterium]MCG2807174.1 DUF3641 domain-containing protein [Coriobacteriia bacterium]
MRLESQSPESAATRFAQRVERANPTATSAASLNTLMINIGLRCDMACAHCHQSSSPVRPENMSRETMLDSMRLADILRPALLDITGGEPTLWEHLPEMVGIARGADRPMRIRTNLVALARPQSAGLPSLLARQGVSLLASLPGVTAADVAEQRGAAFAPSLAVLRLLATLGYANGDPSLRLDLAYNPPLGELPRPTTEIAEEFRLALEPLGVRFNDLLVIANVPAGRFAHRLKLRGEYDAHISRLDDAFNPDILGELSCRHGIEIAWDGGFADCDFNLGAGLRVVDGPRDLFAALGIADSGGDIHAALATRRIAFGPHCFACTVGAGSG